MSLLSLQDHLDQGISLPVVPDLLLPPLNPAPLNQQIGASWYPPSPPSLSQVGPLQLKRWNSQTTHMGQHCCPSQIQKLWSSVIWDFLGLEHQMGTWEVTQAFREELEMHQIELNDDVLGCRDCSVKEPHIYCP